MYAQYFASMYRQRPVIAAPHPGMFKSLITTPSSTCSHTQFGNAWVHWCNQHEVECSGLQMLNPRKIHNCKSNSFTIHSTFLCWGFPYYRASAKFCKLKSIWQSSRWRYTRGNLDCSYGRKRKVFGPLLVI